MNRQQTQAIMELYHQCSDPKKPNIMLLEGPPGSGKSVVIANLIEQLRKGPNTKQRNLKILICAQSNGATDNITVILMNRREDLKVNLVRYGIDEKINQDAKTVSLRSLAIAKHDSLMRMNPETALLLDQVRIN
jgi:senataxin